MTRVSPNALIIIKKDYYVNGRFYSVHKTSEEHRVHDPMFFHSIIGIFKFDTKTGGKILFSNSFLF